MPTDLKPQLAHQPFVLVSKVYSVFVSINAENQLAMGKIGVFQFGMPRLAFVQNMETAILFGQHIQLAGFRGLKLKSLLAVDGYFEGFGGIHGIRMIRLL